MFIKMNVVVKWLWAPFSLTPPLSLLLDLHKRLLCIPGELFKVFTLVHIVTTLLFLRAFIHFHLDLGQGALCLQETFNRAVDIQSQSIRLVLVDRVFILKIIIKILFIVDSQPRNCLVHQVKCSTPGHVLWPASCLNSVPAAPILQP